MSESDLSYFHELRQDFSPPNKPLRSLKEKMQIDFYDQIQTLRDTGNPFVIATVVRAEKPTSAKPGAKAIITEDGTLSGWIGGSCAEPTV